MTKEYRQSGEERKTNDRYFTEPWITKLLLPYIPSHVKQGFILEPSAGRGDMSRVFAEEGYEVLSGDIDGSEFDHEIGSFVEQDFLSLEPWSLDENVKAIITNPPYKDNMADRFVRHALSTPVSFVAMLLRSEFNSASSRMDLWEPPFAYEIQICGTRPRWDWWLPEPQEWEPPRSSPMHIYSWFVWDQNWVGPSTQFFVSFLRKKDSHSKGDGK